jgi:hypothetical protein
MRKMSFSHVPHGQATAAIRAAAAARHGSEACSTEAQAGIRGARGDAL